MNIQKPMLATDADLSKLRYPILCTPKIDGIRCLIINGTALSRSFKHIPNNYIRQILQQCPDGFDGELLALRAGSSNFNATTSAVMTESGQPDFIYKVFDYYTDPTEGYSSRIEHLLVAAATTPIKDSHIEYLIPEFIYNEKELLHYEEQSLSQGYEGVMIRSINGPYKFGRSTQKEGYLLKLKRFADSEAVILSIYEKMHNENELTKDVFGYASRSSHISNFTHANTMGGIIVTDNKTGILFGIGTGFDDTLRKEMWMNPAKYIGKIIKYKHQLCGAKDAPRFPVFVGFRDERDCSLCEH